MDKKEEFLQDPTRRGFLRTMGVGVPTLALLVQGDSLTGHLAEELSARTAAAKFTPVDLTPYFNTSPRGFGPRKSTIPTINSTTWSGASWPTTRWSRAAPWRSKSRTAWSL